MGCERKQGAIYTLPGLLTSPVPNQWGSEASGSGRFRVGRSVWSGRYKRSVSGGGQVIVCSMFVPFLFQCVYILLITWREVFVVYL